MKAIHCLFFAAGICELGYYIAEDKDTKDSNFSRYRECLECISFLSKKCFRKYPSF